MLTTNERHKRIYMANNNLQSLIAARADIDAQIADILGLGNVNNGRRVADRAENFQSQPTSQPESAPATTPRHSRQQMDRALETAVSARPRIVRPAVGYAVATVNRREQRAFDEAVGRIPNGNDARVWDVIRKSRQPITNAEIERATGLSKKAVQSSVYQLRAIIQKPEPGKGIAARGVVVSVPLTDAR